MTETVGLAQAADWWLLGLPGKKQVAIQDAFENVLSLQAGAGNR
jgi:hypothetical protein